MKKLILLTACFGCLAGLSTYAQADKVDQALDNIQVNDDTKFKEWTPGLFFGGELNEGNTESLTLNVGFSLNGARDEHEMVIGGEGSYQETGDDTIAEKFGAEAQYNNHFDDPWYGYARADYAYDDIALIDYRVNVGPGIGRYLHKDDVWDLALEAGPGYLIEEVADEENDGVTIRVAQKYNRVLSEGATLFQQLEYLPLVEDFGDYLLEGTIGVEAALAGGFSTRIAIKDRYDPEPGAGLDENDLQVIAGIIYKFQ